MKNGFKYEGHSMSRDVHTNEGGGVENVFANFRRRLIDYSVSFPSEIVKASFLLFWGQCDLHNFCPKIWTMVSKNFLNHSSFFTENPKKQFHII